MCGGAHRCQEEGGQVPGSWSHRRLCAVWDVNSLLEEQEVCCLSSYNLKKILFKIALTVSRDDVIFPMNEALERWLGG